MSVFGSKVVLPSNVASRIAFVLRVDRRPSPAIGLILRKVRPQGLGRGRFRQDCSDRFSREVTDRYLLILELELGDQSYLKSHGFNPAC